MQRKYYTSLEQLMKELVQDPLVQVLRFTGFDLIVMRGKEKIRYGLCDGVVSESVVE
jgi:hypothetical protein